MSAAKEWPWAAAEVDARTANTPVRARSGRRAVRRSGRRAVCITSCIALRDSDYNVGVAFRVNRSFNRGARSPLGQAVGVAPLVGTYGKRAGKRAPGRRQHDLFTRPSSR